MKLLSRALLINALTCCAADCRKMAEAVSDTSISEAFSQSAYRYDLAIETLESEEEIEFIA